jgi:ATP-dependent Clp protease ATP-binding subunit ClpA
VADVANWLATSAISRAAMMAAIVEAQRRGASSVEAEHVLLALAADRGTPVAALLAEYGLDHDGIARALDLEREQSLRAIGMIEPPTPARLTATRAESRPRWGASSQEAVGRATWAASRAGRQGRHGITVADLLFGVLCLEYGTLPRALIYAGVDRLALRSEVMQQAGIPAERPGQEPLALRILRNR